jgi:hypothetical protein
LLLLFLLLLVVVAALPACHFRLLACFFFIHLLLNFVC